MPIPAGHSKKENAPSWLADYPKYPLNYMRPEWFNVLRSEIERTLARAATITIFAHTVRENSRAVACQKTVNFPIPRLTIVHLSKLLTEEISYRLIKIIEANPEISQRELAQEMGVSLGKANYCLKGLIEKGIIKAQNFKNSNNKLAYAYLLTPKGLEEKSLIAARYLKRRLKEYEDLKKEIGMLQKEVKNYTNTS